MNESGFIRSIHKKLPEIVYAWKISDRFTSGVPDTFYCGDKGLLFIEYKYIKLLPKRSFTPKLSDLQKLWLNERLNNGIPVAVIVGTSQGSIILEEGEWNYKVLIEGRTIYSKDELTNWILQKVVH